ncbi:unnamed protein product [Lampetra fluviatilis]
MGPMARGCPACAPRHAGTHGGGKGGHLTPSLARRQRGPRSGPGGLGTRGASSRVAFFAPGLDIDRVP